MADLPGSFPYHPTAFPGPYQYSGDLPLGRWSMLANGRIFELRITGVQGSQVDATLSSGTLHDVEWDGTANASALATLSFTRVVDNIGLKQRFKGYFLHYDDADPLWRIVGTFGKVGVGDEAGWYATLAK